MKSPAPGSRFFILSGCSLLLAFLCAAGGVTLMVTSSIRAAAEAGATSAATRPVAAFYNCYLDAGSAGKVFVRKFRLADESYEDLSFQQGSGKYEFDPSDSTLNFTDGPFHDHFLGVFVASGAVRKASSKYRFDGDSGTADGDTIRLLDTHTDYQGKSELGVPCRAEP